MNPNGTNMSYGICSADEAKLIGVKLFMQYGGKPNDPKSSIDLAGVEKIFADIYNIIELPFKAGPGDCESMGRVLDENSDGRISLQDMQAICVRYLAQGDQPVQSIKIVQQPVQQTVIVEQPTQKPQTENIRFTFQKAPQYQAPSGQIDFVNEFRKQLSQIYDQSDQNKDSFLSQDEIRTLITNTYQMTFGYQYVPTQDEVYQFISANDQFGDGRIIKEEFIRQVTYEVLKLKGWI